MKNELIVTDNLDRSPSRIRGQRGSVMVELALYLVIATMLQVMQLNQVQTGITASLSKATGQYLDVLQEGANHYVLDNFTPISEGSAVAGFSNPLKPTIAELITAKFLLPTFVDQSPLGLKFALTLTPANCPGLTCTINGQAYSTLPYKDANGDVRNDILGQVMQAAGNDSGVSSIAAPNTLRGFGGSWTSTNPAGATAGTVAIQIGTNSGIASQLSQFYKLDGSRKLTGTMDAAQHDIKNVGNLQASTSINVGTDPVNPCVQLGQTGVVAVKCNGLITATTINSATVTTTGRLKTGEYLQLGAVAVEGSGCASSDLVSRNSAGMILSCQSGIWKSTSAGIKNYADFNWFPGSGTFGTGLPYANWNCAINHVGGKWAGGGEDIQVLRDGGSGTWIVVGNSSSDNSGAYASISCVQLS